jgi:hypothetical protein
MAFAPNSITARYMTDLKTLVVSWLEYHFGDGDGNEGLQALFAEWHGVDISADYPALSVPEDEDGNRQFLRKPRLVVGHSGERIDNTKYTSADGQFLTGGSYHTITVTLTAICDEKTGGQMTADDLMSAVGICYDRYRLEVEPVGVNFLKLQESRTEVTGDGTIRNYTEILADVQVRGSNLQTVVLTMGSFTLTADAQGTYTDGHEITTASDLRIRCTTGFRVVDTVVTVNAKNQDDVATTLTGTIAAGTSAGTLVALTPANVSDTFTDVTNISVTGGIAGEAFVVENVPQEV